MSAMREQLHKLVDSLPEREVATAQRFLSFLAQEPIEEDFAQSIRRGLAEADSGQTIECRDYNDMVTQLLDGK